MVSNLYESLLQELGQVLGLELTPDKNNSCLVKLKGGLEVQFELNPTGDRFLMGTNLGSAPPGRYRDALFREALKTNGMPPPRPGVLAFSPKADCLVLFRWLPAREINGERIAFLLGPFAERAMAWRQAIQHGDIPQFEGPSARGHAGLFGLR